MIKRNRQFHPVQDFVSEEMAAALLSQKSFDFSGLFEAVHARLRVRNATGSGKEMLRLRIYEKLQVLVSQGVVKKDAKIYSGVPAALKGRIAEMAAAKAAREQRRTSSMLHAE
jgi:hypothetical protein